MGYAHAVIREVDRRQHFLDFGHPASPSPSSDHASQSHKHKRVGHNKNLAAKQILLHTQFHSIYKPKKKVNN